MIRVRFAPSPTGYLHVGGARTALYSFLYAKKHKGQFILRIEDTDVERSTEESMRLQLADLKWLGYLPDEGVHPDTLMDVGSCGPYRQSQRLAIYREYADKLLKESKAYYCFLTDAEIEQQREDAKKNGRPHQVLSPYRNMKLQDAEAKIKAGESAVVRFKVPDLTREYSFTDLVRGEVKFPSDMVGDFVCLRSGGMPVYNFCCTVDDALMKMTHVFRAEEHLSNTLRQLMLYEAFGFDVPQFGHLSIILGSDKQKLSKRHGATSVNDYREKGYLPEAMTNFLALLGWSSPDGEELLSFTNLTEQFSTDRLHAAPAVFDETKLKWVNAQHLRTLAHDDLWNRLDPFFKKAELILPDDKNWQDRSLSVFKTSMELLTDAIELYRPLAQNEFIIHDEAKEALSWSTSKTVIEEWKKQIEAHKGAYITESEFVALQNSVKDTANVKGKELFMPIRVAVVGKPHGAELKILVPLLDKKVLLDRAKLVLSEIGD